MGDELPPWVTDISKLLLKRSSFSGNVLLSLRSDYDPTLCRWFLEGGRGMGDSANPTWATRRLFF